MTHRRLCHLMAAVCCLTGLQAKDSVKVFVLAGDDTLLRQGSIDGIPRGPGSKPVDPEVAAFGQSGRWVNPNISKIRDAQLAVGDPAKYPAFEGNVTVVDTLPPSTNSASNMTCRRSGLPRATWPTHRTARRTIG